MPTPSSYPPEPSLDAIEGRATFDGHAVRLERWGREADRRRCAYAAAPIGSVRGARVMTTPDTAFLVIDVVAPDGKATGIPTRPGALARSVWTLRVPDPAKAARFAGMVARHAPAEAVPLDRAPRADRRPFRWIARRAPTGGPCSSSPSPPCSPRHWPCWVAGPPTRPAGRSR